MSDFQIGSFLAALFGASLQELLYWFDLKHHLDDPENQKTLRSPGYWIITLLMIGASAVGVLYWYGGNRTVEPRDYVLAAAAFPLLFKHAVSALGQSRRVLGSRPPTPSVVRSSLTSYFQIGNAK